MPDDVFDAVVKVLACLGLVAAPGGVVAMPSAQPAPAGPQPGRAAGPGRPAALPRRDWATGRAGPDAQYNSAQRVQAIRTTLAMPAALGAAVAAAGGPVLLVDDRVDTGWTMTLGAAMLRHAGAPAVLPLALAVTS